MGSRSNYRKKHATVFKVKPDFHHGRKTLLYYRAHRLFGFDFSGIFEADAQWFACVDVQVALREGDDNAGLVFFAIVPGWNYIVWLYQPKKEVLDGTWTFPDPEPVE